MKIGILGLLFLGVTQICSAQFSLRSGQSVTVACDNTEEKVVQTAYSYLHVIMKLYFLLLLLLVLTMAELL